MINRLLCSLFGSILLCALTFQQSEAGRIPRGVAPLASGFNGGKAQVGMNFSGFAGDYPTLNRVKDSAMWSLADNTGVPYPTDISQTTGYLVPGSDAAVNHGGIYTVIFLASQKDAGSDYFMPVTGKGTVLFGAILTINASSITPGSNTSLVFASTPDFRAGMEVPITGTTGTLSVTNAGNTGPITNGGANGAFTVCTGYVTGSLTVPLCLSDQVTPVTTTGTATGTTTVAYGRAQVGVATKGLMLVRIADNPMVSTLFELATDATTPISDIAIVPKGSYPRYEQFLAGTCPGGYNPACQFDAYETSVQATSNFGVMRFKDKYYSDFDLSVNWADRTPVGYFSWASGQIQQSKWTTSVSSVNNDYSVTFGSGAPADKTQIIFTFDSAAVNFTGNAINWTNTLSVGQPFNIFYAPSATLPTGLPTDGFGNPLVNQQLPQPFYVQARSGTQVTSFTRFPPYNANVTYSNADTGGIPLIVDYLGTAYVSLVTGNKGNTPSSSPSQWQIGGPTYNSATQYGVDDRVNSGGTAYRSLQANNIGNTPASSPTFWAASSSSSIALTTTGSGTITAHSTVFGKEVGLTNSSTSILWPAHGVSVNDPVSCIAIQTANTLQNSSNLYVQSVIDADHVTLSSTVGGSAITIPTPVSGAYNTVLNYPVIGGSNAQCVRSPTINVNGTGAIPLRDINANGIGLGFFSQPLSKLYGKTQTYGLVTLHKVLNQWHLSGSSGATLTLTTRSLWPPEIGIQYAITVGAHPYFPAPPYVLDGATDPTTHLGGATDYIPEWMNYAKNTAPSWMVPRWEGNNEKWNGQFMGTLLGQAYTTAYSDPNNPYYGGASWVAQQNAVNAHYGKEMSILGQMAHAVYGGVPDSTKYEALLGVQTFTYSQSAGTTNNKSRFESTEYVGQTTGAQTGLTYSGGTINFAKDPAYKWFTHTASAQYFTPGLYNTTIANAGSTSEEAITASYPAGEFYGYITAPNQLVVGGMYNGASSDIGVGTAIYGYGIPPNTTILSGTYPNFTISNSTAGNLGTSGTQRAFQFGPTTVPSNIQNYVDSAVITGTFNGQIDGTTGILTVNSISYGIIYNANVNGGDHILWSGSDGYTQIGTQISGSVGGSAGATYNTNYRGANVSAQTMTDAGVFSTTMVNIMTRNICAMSASYTNAAGAAGRCTGYEGGWSPDYGAGNLAPTGSGGKLNQVRWKSKYVFSTSLYPQGTRQLVLLNLNNAKQWGLEYPSMFTFAANTPITQVWGALEDMYQLPSASPYYLGYQDYH